MYLPSIIYRHVNAVRYEWEIPFFASDRYTIKTQILVVSVHTTHIRDVQIDQVQTRRTQLTSIPLFRLTKFSLPESSLFWFPYYNARKSILCFITTYIFVSKQIRYTEPASVIDFIML